jgi:hypothetical protein
MLEYIVRPFQAPNAHGTIIIPSTPKASTETAILTWGGESTLPEVQYTEVGFNTKKSREDFTEKKRDSEVVRITGNDPENYIDVSRANKLYLDKETGRVVQADSPGQSDYVANTDLEDNPNFEPLSTQAPIKSKATMKLNNNTTAPAS